MKITRSLIIAFIIFPLNVMGTIPVVILLSTRKGIEMEWSSVTTGCLLIVIGILGVYHTVSLFTDYGDGTPAPFNPPRNFVALGLYRCVRNPMIIGVMLILLGQSIAFRSLPLFCWFLFFTAANLIYIPLIEEPHLKEKFGGIYKVYLDQTPRWIPRYASWKENEKI
tara:strand:- start:2738 stop:3238 length:501 start_codon:yes stop_codon:yes gene_type:complete